MEKRRGGGMRRKKVSSSVPTRLKLSITKDIEKICNRKGERILPKRITGTCAMHEEK